MTDRFANEYVFSPRFFEVDRAGIVFFGRVFEYCHSAYEELMAAIYGGLERTFQSGWGMPLVHSEADYFKPMRMGDKLVIRMYVERLGNRSITFRHEIHGREDGSHRATCRLIHAFVDMATFTPRPMPESLREGLQREGLVSE